MTARLTRAQRIAILEDQNCKCPVCLNVISHYENFEIDHINPRWFDADGKDERDNLRALHYACHRMIKTPQDIKTICKTKRIAEDWSRHKEARATGTRTPNKKERKLARWQENRPQPETPRQE